jgi:hypothetical protein
MGGRVNVAVHVESLVNVTAPEELQSPDQPENIEPELATAFKVIGDDAATVALHVSALFEQLIIPVGLLLVMVPVPVPVELTIRV